MEIKYVGRAADFKNIDKDGNGYLDAEEVSKYNAKHPNSKIQVFVGMIVDDYTNGITEAQVLDSAYKDGYCKMTFADEGNAWTETTSESMIRYAQKRINDKKHPILGAIENNLRDGYNWLCDKVGI